MCKSAEAKQQGAFGQPEEASHGTFLYILLFHSNMSPVLVELLPIIPGGLGSFPISRSLTMSFLKGFIA